MSVRKEDNNTWSVRCWYRNWKGERKQKTKRGFLKQKDAKQWERSFLSQEQKRSVSMNLLIEEYKQYMCTLENLGNLKASTRNNKLNYIQLYIDGYFGSAPVENITPAIIEQWLADITKKHSYGKRMASGTLKIARSILSQIFDYGKKNYGIESNPVKESILPAKYSNDERVAMWTIDQFNTFYNSLTREIDKTVFLTLYWSGLRIGELLALTPADIRPCVISVTKTWVSPIGKGGYASSPKTHSSIRDVIIPDFLYEQLNSYITGLGTIKPTDRIFPLYAPNLANIIRQHAEKLGLPKASLHTMRHSYASNLLAETNDYVTTASQLGHSSPEITLKVYAHKVEQNATQTIEKLSKFANSCQSVVKPK